MRLLYHSHDCGPIPIDIEELVAIESASGLLLTLLETADLPKELLLISDRLRHLLPAQFVLRLPPLVVKDVLRHQPSGHEVPSRPVVVAPAAVADKVVAKELGQPGGLGVVGERAAVRNGDLLQGKGICVTLRLLEFLAMHLA